MPHSLRHEPNNDHRRAAGDVAPLLPAPDWRQGRNDRLFVEAMCWILRNGAAWRNLPQGSGHCRRTVPIHSG
ncbi:MAG: transposase [Puniceicoccales bacterium]|nr:transposase [Puniceicoccales bacterium]